ncbi:MAG: sigma-70 family RNA polymerase sigma factor [Phycisphaerales bacterium]|nr:sigma-70 family RNA polymerase sigma factor [Phycisphaerales bacterium]
MTESHRDAADEQWGRRLETAYREHRELIVNLLRRRYPMQAIEDAVQELFTRWLVRAPSSSVTREIMLRPAYLVHCVRKRVIRTLVDDEHHRLLRNRATDRGAIDSSEGTKRGSDPAHCEEPQFDSAQLNDAIDRLPPHQQEVMRALCSENLRRHESGRAFGCTEDCFGVRRHRGLEKLREVLTHRAADHVRVGRNSPSARSTGATVAP